MLKHQWKSVLWLCLSLAVLFDLVLSEVTIKFSKENYGILNESADAYKVIEVERSGRMDAPFTAIVELVDPKDNDDFTSTSWTLFFPPNNQNLDTRTTAVFVVDDNEPEDDEQFTFQLRASSRSVAIGDISHATLVIPANDDAHGIVGLHQEVIEVQETNGKDLVVPISIKRERGRFGDILIRFQVSNNRDFHENNIHSNSTVNDLRPISSEVTILDGESEKVFEIFVVDDKIPENEEEFFVLLTAVSGGCKINESANILKIVISGNDSPLRFAYHTKFVSENAGEINIEVLRGKNEDNTERIGPDNGEVLIDYRVTSGTAREGIDYNVQQHGTLRFGDKQHNSSIKIFILEDEIPEVAENFMVELIDSTIIGDAILANPSTCEVTIETNDKANGVLSINFTLATVLPKMDEVFLIDEDLTAVFNNLSIIRRGGSFEDVSVQWRLVFTDSNISPLSPDKGTMVFGKDEVLKLIHFDVEQNQEPQEAIKIIFELLPDTVTGGAELEGRLNASMIVVDSDDVYGVFSIEATQGIVVNGDSENRYLDLRLVRNGGSKGKVVVRYSAYYLPAGVNDTRDSMPGVLINPHGVIEFEEGSNQNSLVILIEEEAFLQQQSTFLVKLEEVNLIDHSPIVKPKTPQLQVNEHQVSIIVTEEFANSEIGFSGNSEIVVSEPDEESSPLKVSVEIIRQGLSGETVVHISYRNGVVPGKEVTRDQDYIPGNEIITLKPGERSALVEVTILADLLPETDEVLTVRIDRVEPANQKLKRDFSEKQIIIQENDSPGGIFQFADSTNSSYIVEEDESNTVTLNIVRSEGDLVSRLIEYDVYPNGSDQFYGVPDILVFEPGQRTRNISLVPKNDDIPELTENYTLELKSYGEPESVLGDNTEVSITVLANDDPNGVFIMAEENEDMHIAGRTQTILESTKTTNYSAYFTVRRTRGLFDEAYVDWKVIPNNTNDIFPVSGQLTFVDGDFEHVIKLTSTQDDVPESMEEFAVILATSSLGKIGADYNSSLIIESNDKAVSFLGSNEINVEEGSELSLTIVRDGSGSDEMQVRYRTRKRNHTKDELPTIVLLEALPEEDFYLIPREGNNGIVTFPTTSLEQTISIPIYNDSLPEDNEEFFVELSDATGDYVVNGNTIIHVIITQNDDANGVFQFTNHDTENLIEGVTSKIFVTREFGKFRNVRVYWKIVDHITDDHIKKDDLSMLMLTSDNEFEETEGFIDFQESEFSKAINITATHDHIPEYEEYYSLVLTNVTGERAKLTENVTLLHIDLKVTLNDYPHGKIKIANTTVYLAEEIDEPPSTPAIFPETNVTFTRTMGSDDIIKVSWEMYNHNIEMPRCKDLLLASESNINITEVIDPNVRRSNTGTVVYQFLQGAKLTIPISDHPDPKEIESGFSFAVWLKPLLNLNTIHLITKRSQLDDGVIYHMSIINDENSLAQLQFIYRTTDIPTIEKQAIVFLNSQLQEKLQQDKWVNIIVNCKLDSIIVFLDTEEVGRSELPESLPFYDIIEESNMLMIGAPYQGSVSYMGYMQDVRIYYEPLNNIQISELYNLNSQKDVKPVSGYVSYNPAEVTKNVTIYSIPDDLTETSEIFDLKVLDVSNSGGVSDINSTAVITVLKSDNANGLFGFDRECEPKVVAEGGIILCNVARTLGTNGQVTVHWKIQNNLPPTFIDLNQDDFLSDTGQVLFEDGQTLATFNVSVIDDITPEIVEKFVLILDSAESHDGVVSTSMHSGASIDDRNRKAHFEISKGDDAHGSFQFSLSKPPTSLDEGMIGIVDEPIKLSVTEEQGVVELLVVRAGGWHGDVTVEWRTRDGTAISHQAPSDFKAAAGTLHFKNGEGYQFINITLLDDEESELEKSFFVDLLTPTGGATLSPAAQIEITIEPSDNAYGVYQFDDESLNLNVLEPQEGENVTELKVIRTGGRLGRTVLKWRVQSDTNSDLGVSNGEVTFEFGQVIEYIYIPVLSDDKPEFDEHFAIELTEVSHGVLGGSGSLISMITIPANDDPYGKVVFYSVPASVSEDNKNVTLTVLREGGTVGTIRIYYETVDSSPIIDGDYGTATADRDFLRVTSSLLMPENVTQAEMAIRILEDDIPETEEVFFVKLTSVELLLSPGSVSNSPRLGNDIESTAKVVILENDSPHGVLELKPTLISVPENISETNPNVPLVEIVRKYGTFGDVTVGVNAIPGNARPLEDYNLVESEITLKEGENSKSVPVYIINDVTPELEEDFTVELLSDSITGGATLGEKTTCRITIEKSDDPYGALEISVDQLVVEEPPPESVGSSVTFTVKRGGGLRGVAAVQWNAFVTRKNDSVLDQSEPKYDYDTRSKDIDVSSGVLYFVTDEDLQQFTIKILPDDIPEYHETLTVVLDHILPTYRGTINKDKDRAIVTIPANDNPYGIVSLTGNKFNINEENNSQVKLDLKRSEGLFGSIRIVYSTEEIDLVSELMETDSSGVLKCYKPSSMDDVEGIFLEKDVQFTDITSSNDPVLTCAESCLRQRTCDGYLFNSGTYECAIVSSAASGRRERVDEYSANGFRYSAKNETKVKKLYDSQARSGMDFKPITGASVLMEEGKSTAEVLIDVIDDEIPELDEFFKVKLMSVSVLYIDALESDGPFLGENRTSRITINENDHPYGIFSLQMSMSSFKGNGSYIEVEERSQFSVEMIVERKGGDVGEVSVECAVVGGDALRNVDFVGDDVTLKFSENEIRKVISISVIDDDVPELNEFITLQLRSPTGGATVNTDKNSVNIVILANDNVGGIVSFLPGSRAVIGNEGDEIQLDLVRESPAEGVCEVSWKVTSDNGLPAHHGVNITEGTVVFEDGVKMASMWISLIKDDTPEVKEEYKVTLSNPVSKGIPVTGSAALDKQGSVSEISITASDNPHGVFRFAASSQVVGAIESDQLDLFISRQFGVIGKVKVNFAVIPGTLSTLNPDIDIAQPGVDFLVLSSNNDQYESSVVFEDGETTVPIYIKVTDDDIPELNEIFHVNLTSAELISDRQGMINFIPPAIDPDNSMSQVVIDANDGTKGVLSFHESSVNISTTEIEGENRTIDIEIVRERGTYGEVTVFVFPQNQEAILNVDYFCNAETIQLLDGQDSATFSLIILDDDKPEGQETFEILLGNTSPGLELGNETKSTITILSNDDAHGKLSFISDSTIFLEEPSDNSIMNSRAELIVQRNPGDGVFGQVSVQFRIEQKHSNKIVTDLMPAEGYIVINDGVQQEAVEISVVADNDAELEEEFVVTLFNPQNGATLNSENTTTTIIVKENDAPFGEFRIYPRGIRENKRNMEVKEGPGIKVLELDIVRDQGTTEDVYVDVRTESLTAVSLTPNSSILSVFQKFDSVNVESFHTFEYNNNQFLVVLTSERSGPLTSTIGSSGTISTLTTGVHSTIYRFQGVFTPMQTIETDGASSAISFQTQTNFYLFITNMGKYGRNEVLSRLYKVKEDGGLTVVADCETNGATDASVFKFNGKTFLVVANSVDNNQVSGIDSFVYRFDENEEQLSLIQTLPTRGASAVKTFQWNSNIYLAISNRHDSEVSGNAFVSSVLYKWLEEDERDGSFGERYPVDVSHSTDVAVINHPEGAYVIFTSGKKKIDQVESTEANEVHVFKMVPNTGSSSFKLEPIQIINSSGVKHINTLTGTKEALGILYKDRVNDYNKQCHFLGISGSKQSVLLKLDENNNHFNPYLHTGATTVIFPFSASTKFRNMTLIAAAMPRHSQELELNNTIAISGVYSILSSKNLDFNDAADDGDYLPVPASFSIKFNEGQTLQRIAVSIMDDKKPENLESFKIVLDKSHDDRIEISENFGFMTVDILSSDSAHGILGFSLDSVEKSVEETDEDNTFTLNVDRNIGAYEKVSVNWVAEGSISDISPVNGTIVFENGQTSAGILLTVLADNLPEVEEVVEVYLTEVVDSGNKRDELGAHINRTLNKATINILANDSPHGVVRWSDASLKTVVNEPGAMIGAMPLVTLEVIREQGKLGDIEVFFETVMATNLPVKSQAKPGADFISRKDSLILHENKTVASIAISIVPDDIAEDIESFFVVITDVRNIGESQFGGKPGLGQPGTELAEITIDENDNARGFVQFNVSRNAEGAVEAFELPYVNSSLKLSVVRLVGTFRSVGVEWVARPSTAQTKDFFPTHGSLNLVEGQDEAEIEIFIVDDEEVEFMETFSVQLIGTTGGVKLGGDLTVTANILPNDSPSGMFGFLSTVESVTEPVEWNTSSGRVEFKVQRFQGSSDDVIVSWRLDAEARDDLTPLFGQLHFHPGERIKSIVLRSLPDQLLEGDEDYVITLESATGGAEISPVAGKAKVRILADDGAAGTVVIDQSSSVLITGESSETYDGKLFIKLKRGIGTFGDVQVYWEIIPSDANTFVSTEGEALFKNLESECNIQIETINDKIAESSQDYVLRLSSATGGADINPDTSSIRIIVAASDYPHGTFTFSQPVYHVKEESGSVKETGHTTTSSTPIVVLTLLRNDGHIGEVAVSVSTVSGTASENSDYFPVSKKLVFTDGESYKNIQIELINDARPEGPEEFYLNITHVLLLSHQSNDYSKQGMDEISLDMPPRVGEVANTTIEIAKNDGAEGQVEFALEADGIRVAESNGTVEVPLIRSGGSYGDISVTIMSSDITAKRGDDYLAPLAGLTVTLRSDQNHATVSVPIIDDSIMENEESFSLSLRGVHGGAVLGKRIMAEIFIEKSDYPNGLIRFVGTPSHISVRNPTRPSQPNRNRFIVERTGGNKGNARVKWKVVRAGPFFGKTTRSTPVTDDISLPVYGELSFGDNEGGQREININILPVDSNEEVEENFVLLIEDASPAEISPTDGNVTITVLKKGHPNGVLEFKEENSQAYPKIGQEPPSRQTQLVFKISRKQGFLGKVSVDWIVSTTNNANGADPATDLIEYQGTINFRDEQTEAEIILTVADDDVPELAEEFSISLTEVHGGVEVNPDKRTKSFVIEANDDPHGVFAVYSTNQNVILQEDTSRAIQLNVTRHRGSFGVVIVAYSVQFDNPKDGETYLTTNSGTINVLDESTWEVAYVPIANDVFLAVGDTFTVELNSIEYMGEDLSIPPKLSERTTVASISVPPEAANAQIGFDPTIARVHNITRHACLLGISRIGLYGDVTVNWMSEHPTTDLPQGFRNGHTMPKSDSFTMSRLQSSANISLTLFPDSSKSEIFGAQLTSVVTPSQGGAVIISNRGLAKIDPCGVVKFASESQQIETSSESLMVNLIVERIYGSQFDIDVTYSTVPISALPEDDYVPVINGRTVIKNGEQFSRVSIQLVKDNRLKTARQFMINITGSSQAQNIYRGLSPRVLFDESKSIVTIKESENAHGVFMFVDVKILADEESIDGSRVVVLIATIKRAVGSFGEVVVTASTIGGGEEWEKNIMQENEKTSDSNIFQFLSNHRERRAQANKDYEARKINVTFHENISEVKIPIVVLDDDEPEPDESFFVYLEAASGGGKIAGAEAGGIIEITIKENDFPNGRIGFKKTKGLSIFEDSLSHSIELLVSRKYAYGNYTVKWRATNNNQIISMSYSNPTSVTSYENFDLQKQLVETSGKMSCPAGQQECKISITSINDQIPEFASWFLVELFDVTAGAMVDPNRRSVNITMEESDYPFGFFQFSLKSRLPVVSKQNKAVGLTIERIGGQEFEVQVHFVTEQLKKIVNLAGTTLYPAVSDIDYKKTDGRVTFKPGQTNSFIEILLHPEQHSTSPLPQIFQVQLTYVSGQSSINYNYNVANVTIVGNDATKTVWGVYEALQQNLDDVVIQSVIAQLRSLADDVLNKEQAVIFHGCLSHVIGYATKHSLPTSINDAIYNLFCKLLDPYRTDAIMGYSEMNEMFEKFAYSLLSDVECLPTGSGTIVYNKCSYATLQAARWYPELINGFMFKGKTEDYFKVPVDLLDVEKTGIESKNPQCYDISLIELSSHVWFAISGEKGPMSNKVFSVSIKNKEIMHLSTPVRFRVYTTDARISPKGAECVLWNQASSSWLSSSDTCFVEDDSSNYVDCACHHMSVYASRGPTDNLAGYNEATYVACFICAVAALVIILGHHVCSSNSKFATKLLMHMCFSIGITQIIFVVSSFTSSRASRDGCVALGVSLHYFWLAQFMWMLMQAINIYQILILNNEKMDRLYALFFILGWGLPAVVVLLHIIVMYAVGVQDVEQIYGDIHDNGEMCMIMNGYATLLSGVVPPCLCLMITGTIGLHLYQRGKIWMQYDDVYKGHFNASEIPLLLWLFFIITVTWVFGGLHLAYGYMWLLALFILFNFIQGFYLLIVYGILHNPFLRPTKESPEDIVDGTMTTQLPAGYDPSIQGSRPSSVSGDILNRSTQYLVSKESPNWIEADYNATLPADHFNAENYPQDDSGEFDDLMLALKSGAGKTTGFSNKGGRQLDVINDGTESSSGGRRKSADLSSQGFIADTHL